MQGLGLFTPVIIQSSGVKINYKDKILSLGSCFSDNIGHRLKNAGFNVHINPFGTIFNSHSLANILDSINNPEYIVNEAMFQNNSDGQVFHFDYTSKLNCDTKEDYCKNLKNIVNEIEDIDILLITLGTSYVYELQSVGNIVANCHKQNQNLFNKTLLSTDYQYEKLHSTIKQLKTRNEHLRKVVVTVSPVRHTKDGMVENTRSKARLLEVCHRLVESDDMIEYFPSFEIMIEELRDYRFYCRDLIHPNDLAIDIIWEKFSQSNFNLETITISLQMENYNQLKRHIPMSQSGKEAQLKKLISMQEVLIQKYPDLNFDKRF